MATGFETPSFLGALTPVRIAPARSRLLAFFSSFFGTGGAADSLTRPFVLETQSQTEWCWAAVAAAVRRYLDGQSQSLSQCQVAERVLPGLGCCARPSSAQCNRSAALAAVLQTLGNRQGPILAGSIDPDSLRRQLRADRPVCCAIVNGALGHFVVITGCFAAQGLTFVTLMDPSYGNSPKTVSFADLRYGYRQATWKETYLTKRSGG